MDGCVDFNNATNLGIIEKLKMFGNSYYSMNKNTPQKNDRQLCLVLYADFGSFKEIEIALMNSQKGKTAL